MFDMARAPWPRSWPRRCRARPACGLQPGLAHQPRRTAPSPPQAPHSALPPTSHRARRGATTQEVRRGSRKAVHRVAILTEPFQPAAAPPGRKRKPARAQRPHQAVKGGRAPHPASTAKHSATPHPTRGRKRRRRATFFHAQHSPPPHMGHPSSSGGPDRPPSAQRRHVDEKRSRCATRRPAQHSNPPHTGSPTLRPHSRAQHPATQEAPQKQCGPRRTPQRAAARPRRKRCRCATRGPAQHSAPPHTGHPTHRPHGRAQLPAPQEGPEKQWGPRQAHQLAAAPPGRKNRRRGTGRPAQHSTPPHTGHPCISGAPNRPPSAERPHRAGKGEGAPNPAHTSKSSGPPHMGHGRSRAAPDRPARAQTPHREVIRESAPHPAETAQNITLPHTGHLRVPIVPDVDALC